MNLAEKAESYMHLVVEKVGETNPQQQAVILSLLYKYPNASRLFFIFAISIAEVMLLPQKVYYALDLAFLRFRHWLIETKMEAEIWWIERKIASMKKKGRA